MVMLKLQNELQRNYFQQTVVRNLFSRIIITRALWDTFQFRVLPELWQRQRTRNISQVYEDSLCWQVTSDGRLPGLYLNWHFSFIIKDI